MGFKSKRSQKCDIAPKVKKIVAERDEGLCVICKRPGLPNAHYISRAHGGLGIEQNIVTLCLVCHDCYDNGVFRENFKDAIRGYLEEHYENWDESKLVYRKGII